MSSLGPFAALLNSETPSHGVNSERLELLGKKAAANFVNGGVPLNDTLSAGLAEVEGVNYEHVKRACEEANKATFYAMFKAATGETRVPDFPVADPNEVLCGAEKTAAPDEFSADYDLPPMQFVKFAGAQVMEKAASVDRQPMKSTKLANAFPLNDAVSLWEKLGRANAHFRSERWKVASATQAAREQVFGLVKEALHEGYHPAELEHVMLSAERSEGSQQEAHDLLSDAIGEIGPISGAKYASAGLEVDENTDLFKTYSALRGLRIKEAELAEAHSQVQRQHKELYSFLRDHVRE